MSGITKDDIENRHIIHLVDVSCYWHDGDCPDVIPISYECESRENCPLCLHDAMHEAKNNWTDKSAWMEDLADDLNEISDWLKEV